MSSTPQGSRFRTSTPVRAITSTLVNRSSPSLPPASQTYEPLVKSVLRYRLSRVFVKAGAAMLGRQYRMGSMVPPSHFLQVLTSFFVSVVSVSPSLPLACVVFGLGRMVVLPSLYQLPFIPVFLKPFTAHFLLKRGPYTLLLPFTHIPLLARAWFVGLTTFFLWGSAETMFEGIVCEPVPVAASPTNPTANVTLLVSGVSSADPIMKYFAYAELAKLATGTTSSALAHRQALFGNDVKGGSCGVRL
ncbi:hypothetical protein EST38_g8607 [Candolleomyces aberdarensis]|uniref:Uncharacterized protein n=1 Tax=Candolleomyces aberdarensis TaxID=2316362 RepID=A0A4Q2DC18_9AGAR|nr:hypothetical protein EST38_g8607 [Candolleomyces aberdarensis]